MKVLKKGHCYQLANVENPFSDEEQTLQFIEKEADEQGNLVLVSNGTSNEEVLKVLIDRMQYLNSKLASRENSLVITKLEEALLWLQKRTNDRLERGVEGTHKP